MLDRNDDRTINANVDEVLAALRANLTEHNEIVAEARVGYLVKCKEAIQNGFADMVKRVDKIASGGAADANLDAIHFNNLSAPTSHRRQFETVIKMLELHKAAWDNNPANVWKETNEADAIPVPATIELKAVDVQKYVLNDWQWMDQFLLSNAGYSGKSQMLALEKGLL